MYTNSERINIIVKFICDSESNPSNFDIRILLLLGLHSFVTANNERTIVQGSDSGRGRVEKCYWLLRRVFSPDRFV